MFKMLSLILLASGLAISCHDEASPSQPATNTDADKTHFISVTPVQETSVDMLRTLTAALGRNDITTLLKYGVKSYELLYQTTYNGKSIKASGLIYLPKDLKGEAPIISVQHGTTFVKSEAPSV